MVWPVYKPPSGIPAAGTPKGGNGSKGQGTGPPAAPFSAEKPLSYQITPAEAAALNSDPVEIEFRAQRRKLKRALAEKAWAALEAMVDEPAHPAHFNATRELLNRVDGVPVQKTEVTGEDGGPLVTEVVYRWATPDKT